MKLKRPAEDGVVETVAACDLVLSDTTYSGAVNADPVATDVAIPADEMHDNSSSLLPTSDVSSAAASTSSAAENDAAVDCDSVVTDSSSAAVA